MVVVAIVSAVALATAMAALAAVMMIVVEVSVVVVVVVVAAAAAAAAAAEEEGPVVELTALHRVPADLVSALVHVPPTPECLRVREGFVVPRTEHVAPIERAQKLVGAPDLLERPAHPRQRPHEPLEVALADATLVDDPLVHVRHAVERLGRPGGGLRAVSAGVLLWGTRGHGVRSARGREGLDVFVADKVGNNDAVVSPPPVVLFGTGTSRNAHRSSSASRRLSTDPIAFRTTT